MEEKIKLNPWKTIWTRPKETLREISAYKKNYKLYTLSFIHGFIILFSSSQIFSLGSRFSLPAIIAFIVILAIPSGLISISIQSFFFYWVGLLLKGKATYKEVRLAVSWAYVPQVVSIVICIVLMIMFGKDFFTQAPLQELHTGFAGIMLLLSFANLGLGIWELVIFLLGLEEMQKYSFWRVLVNFIFGSIVMFLFLLDALFIFGLVLQVG